MAGGLGSTNRCRTPGIVGERNTIRQAKAAKNPVPERRADLALLGAGEAPRFRGGGVRVPSEPSESGSDDTYAASVSAVSTELEPDTVPSSTPLLCSRRRKRAFSL